MTCSATQRALTVLPVVVAALFFLTVLSQAESRDDLIARQNLSKRLNEYATGLETSWASYKRHVEELISRNDENALSCIFAGSGPSTCMEWSESDHSFRLFDAWMRSYTSSKKRWDELDLFKGGGELDDAKEELSTQQSYANFLACVDYKVAARVKITRTAAQEVSVRALSNVVEFQHKMYVEYACIENPVKYNISENSLGVFPMTGGNTVPLSVQFNPSCTTEDVVEKDGAAKPNQPTTAALLYDHADAGPQTFCTGTLIAPNAVLTAAHCFCLTSSKDPVNGKFFSSYATCHRGFYRRQTEWVRALDPAHHLVYLQHAGVFEIDRIILHPDFRWTDALPRADLAVMILKSNVPGIDPALLADRPVLQPGMIGSSVGYGFSNPIGTDGRPINFAEINEKTGIKLMGRIAPTSCSTGERLRKLICWDYRLHDGITPLASTCNGDSGGPLFMDHDEKTFLVGVTTAGSATCQPGTRAYDMDAYLFSPWIRRVASQNPPATQTVNRQNPRQLACQYCPVCGLSLDNDGNRGTSFPIPAIKKGTNLLRVSVNCTDANQFLKVSLTKAARKAGESPRAIACGKAGKTSIASCEIEVRERDEWTANIETKFPRACQIVATGFN
jgi:hypothetical protein